MLGLLAMTALAGAPEPVGPPEVAHRVEPVLPEGAYLAEALVCRADVTIDEDGSVSDVDVHDGCPEPFAFATMHALFEWRYVLPTGPEGQPRTMQVPATIRYEARPRPAPNPTPAIPRPEPQPVRDWVVPRCVVHVLVRDGRTVSVEPTCGIQAPESFEWPTSTGRCVLLIRPLPFGGGVARVDFETCPVPLRPSVEAFTRAGKYQTEASPRGVPMVVIIEGGE